MSVFLDHSIYLMGNCVGFSNLLELCWQCKVVDRIFLAAVSQVGAWPYHVHPCSLRMTNPWWWDRDVWENDVWTWRGHVDIVMKNVGLFPSSSSIILVFWGGIGLVSVERTVWGIMVDVVTSCCCGESTLWWRLAATLGKISESCSIATIWESPILENVAWGAGFCR